MEVQIETSYVIRMTRLDAAKTLVDPKELQTRLRAVLGGRELGTDVIEGATVTPALSAGIANKVGAGHETRSNAEPSPFVKRAMRKLSKSTKKTPCPLCGKSFKRINVHIAMSHRGGVPQDDAAIQEDAQDEDVAHLVENATV